MPTATRPHRPRGRRRKTEDETAELNQVVNEETLDPPALDHLSDGTFDPFATESQDGIAFMDAIAMITEPEWPGFWLYLYRLDPQVRNVEADSKYIARYQILVSEDDIKQEHGGGKYMFILKENISKEAVQERGLKPRQRRYHFSIEGAPKFLRGQTVVGPNAGPEGSVLPAAPESEGSALAKALPEILNRVTRDRPADAGVSEVSRMIGEAARGAISIVTESTRQQITSATGSTLGDKLLDLMLASKEPKRSAVEEQLIQLALRRLENPESAAAGDGGLGQLSTVKELLGVDSILDLVKGGVVGGDSWKGKLVDTLSAFVANAPALFQLYIQNQNIQFQRELQLRNQPPQVIPGNPAAVAAVQPGVHPPTTDAMPPASRASQPPQATPGVMPMAMDPTAMALDDVVAGFDAGLGGDAVAAFLQRKYPQFVTMFAPLLRDRDQVKLFVNSTPPMNQIAGEEGFQEFLNQFIQEILDPSDEEGGPEEPPPPEAA